MLLAYHEHNVFIIVSNYGNLKNIQNGRKSNKTSSRIETKFEFIFYFVSKGYLYVFRIHAILQMVMMMMMLETSNSFDFVVWSFFGGKHPLISLLMPYYSLLINLCNEEWDKRGNSSSYCTKHVWVLNYLTKNRWKSLC